MDVEYPLFPHMLMLHSIDMNILSIEDKHIHMEFLLEINNYLFELFEKFK
jgi:hypothetical protein